MVSRAKDIPREGQNNAFHDDTCFVVMLDGGAVFYDRFQGNEAFDMLTNPPTTFAPTLVNGFLKDIDARSALLGPVDLNAFDYNGNVPTTYSYSLGLQSRMPYQFALDGTINNINGFGTVSGARDPRIMQLW